jgi:hypothetical protein
MRKIILIQFTVLLIGTVFAWFNFAQELINWLQKRACTTGCAIGLANPFLTPCFYGAIFFTIAFVLSAILIKKSKN